MRTQRNEETLYKQFGASIRTRRKRLRLTQGEVADLADCAELFVRELEAGKPSVRLSKVVDVLRVLGLELSVEQGHNGLRVNDV